MIKNIAIYIFLICSVLFLLNEDSLAARNESFPHIKAIELEGGNKIWLIEDHSLPIVSIKLAFRNSGASYNSPEKAGISYMLSKMLKKGAGDLSSEEFEKKLETLAIHLRFNVDKDNFYISMKTLKKNVKEAFELLSTALTSPKFDGEEASIVKNQIIDELAKRGQDPQYIANLEWNRRFFGKHPYSLPLRGTKKTVKTIKRRDLTAFLSDKFIQPNMVVSIAGDIKDDEAKDLVYEYLYILPKEAPNIDTPFHHNLIPSFDNFPAGKTINITMNVPQSEVIFGFQGVPYKHPEFYPAYILNYILGGGDFESRLMKKIREDKGLVYSIYSYMSNLRYSSLIKGYLGTRNKSSKAAIAMLKSIIKDIREHGVSEKELISAKRYLTGSFFLKMDNNESMTDYLNFMQLERLGIDFLEKRNDKINNVTLEQVNKVASRLMDERKLFTVIAGNNTADKNH